MKKVIVLTFKEYLDNLIVLPLSSCIKLYCVIDIAEGPCSLKNKSLP